MPCLGPLVFSNEERPRDAGMNVYCLFDGAAHTDMR